MSDAFSHASANRSNLTGRRSPRRHPNVRPAGSNPPQFGTSNLGDGGDAKKSLRFGGNWAQFRGARSFRQVRRASATQLQPRGQTSVKEFHLMLELIAERSQ